MQNNEDIEIGDQTAFANRNGMAANNVKIISRQ